MRAIGLSEFGGPDVLREFELPEPEVGPGQVRIRVRAATVNPADAVFREGLLNRAYFGEVTPPWIPGWEAAGVVDAADPASGWRVGDEVTAIVGTVLRARGGYAEQIVLDGDSVTARPAGTDFAAAATLPMNGLTAVAALDQLALADGAALAVTGAAGAVGGYVVQLAKAAGLTVVADAAPADADTVRAFGADVVVARGDSFAEQVRRVFPAGVDAVIDAAVVGAAVLAAVRDGGAYAALRRAELTGGVESVRGIAMHDVKVPEYIHRRDRLDGLRELVEAGRLTLRVARTLPVTEVAAAHRLLNTRGLRGRIVLEF
ncbi:NADP-dependent oxidoreductase [Nocardia sp. BMG111209]|uniref:NADP-dependent oxidoreductase n=1 Tax=Nocardia sp. BMG111209 TaxID=1160137 RepID=UPI0003769EAB|nr:NADP-dependent oxidoreductase [Nocardia sp. BMG111209]